MPSLVGSEMCIRDSLLVRILSKKTAFKKAFGPAQREAFARAKRALTSAPVLKYPDFTREFIVHTDASEAGVGAFLAQRSRESSISRSTLTRK